jgi:2-succinyl-6-hydroxy-2,4-cyclohexadiene-1-carboxylate synthase
VTPLVLVHGFTGSPASFDELAAWLGVRAVGRRILRPALLGHAACAGPAPLHFEQEVDRLALEIQRAGMIGAHLCGYSLGARLCLGLLARYARLFSAATLIGVHPGLASASERAARVGADERWCELLAREGSVSFSRAWEAQPLFDTQRRLPEDRCETQRRIRRRHAASGLCRALRVLGLGQMPDYRGVLRSQPLRVRLVVGALDAKFLALAEQLAGAAAQVELEIVPAAGHNLLLEAPEQLAAVLIRALEAPA